MYECHFGWHGPKCGMDQRGIGHIARDVSIYGYLCRHGLACAQAGREDEHGRRI